MEGTGTASSLSGLYHALTEDGIIDESLPDHRISKAENENLPLIDLDRLNSDNHSDRSECINDIIGAASEWGFFQVVNHGVPEELLRAMKYEQKKAFHEANCSKNKEGFFNLRECYRLGNPVATSPSQISWSEAFHIAVKDISRLDQNKSFRPTIEAVVTKLFNLAKSLAEILSENLGQKSTYFDENCPIDQSYVRLNRYPPCTVASEVYGLIPHTDTDFLTILYQNQVEGLQLLKDGKWFGVKPNPQALIVNVGDLLQAISNDVYKSLKHRVMASEGEERLSLAFFYCPSRTAVIESCSKPGVYRKFSFGEYRNQVDKDVKDSGNKVGLSRFLL